MSDEYNCYRYAIELGFTEAEARLLQASKVGLGQDATVLRRIATAKGLASMKPIYPMPSNPIVAPVARVKRKRTTRRKPNKKE